VIFLSIVSWIAIFLIGYLVIKAKRKSKPKIENEPKIVEKVYVRRVQCKNCGAPNQLVGSGCIYCKYPVKLRRKRAEGTAV